MVSFPSGAYWGEEMSLNLDLSLIAFSSHQLKSKGENHWCCMFAACSLLSSPLHLFSFCIGKHWISFLMVQLGLHFRCRGTDCLCLLPNVSQERRGHSTAQSCSLFSRPLPHSIYSPLRMWFMLFTVCLYSVLLVGLCPCSS